MQGMPPTVVRRPTQRSHRHIVQIQTEQYHIRLHLIALYITLHYSKIQNITWNTIKSHSITFHFSSETYSAHPTSHCSNPNSVHFCKMCISLFTFHYLHCISLHFISLNCKALNYILLCCIAFNAALHSLALKAELCRWLRNPRHVWKRRLAWPSHHHHHHHRSHHHYIASHHITFRYIALDCVTLHCSAMHQLQKSCPLMQRIALQVEVEVLHFCCSL